MAMYGIMRVEKRARSAVYGLQIEANRTEQDHQRGREFDASDIDWSDTKKNIRLHYTKRWNSAITNKIKAEGLKERKNAIVLLDGVYTASEEFFDGKNNDEITAYFKECLAFHLRAYCENDKSLLINAVIHLDEKTPHLHIASIPLIHDEKGAHLSAKIIMGDRSAYRKRQDRFYDEVAGPFGMDRCKQVEYEKKEVGDKLILSRTEDARVHTTKRAWQIAQQEEQLATGQDALDELHRGMSTAARKKRRAEEQKDQIEKELADYELKIQIAKNQLKDLRYQNDLELKKAMKMQNFREMCDLYKRAYDDDLMPERDEEIL